MDESLALYQILHVSAGRVRDLDRHLALIDRASRDLFGAAWRPDRRRIEQDVLEQAGCPYYNRTQATFVRLEVTEDGAWTIRSEGVSLYSGFALRSVHPAGVSVAGLTPMNGYPLKARVVSARAARCKAELLGGEVAVQVGADGYYHTVEGSPLAAVRGKTLWVTPEDLLPDEALAGATAWNREEEWQLPLRILEQMPPCSVECLRMIEAAEKSGLTVLIRPFAPADVALFDEMFWADHRGITALSKCDGRPMMALVAERIAAAMN